LSVIERHVSRVSDEPACAPTGDEDGGRKVTDCYL